jgi:hypothetical protein
VTFAFSWRLCSKFYFLSYTRLKNAIEFIIRQGLISIDCIDHFSNRLIQTNENRARNDVVSDIEFRDFGNGGERADVSISQTVTGSDD